MKCKSYTNEATLEWTRSAPPSARCLCQKGRVEQGGFRWFEMG